MSEKDDGIYDAMNKGIELATGEWVNFMNAGDTFNSIDVLKKVAAKLNSDLDIVYGDIRMKYSENNIQLRKPLKLNQFYTGMFLFHQSTFIRLELHKEYKYSLNYKIAGDFKFFFDMYIKGKVFFYIPYTIAIFDCNGISVKNHLEAFKENRDIVLSNNNEYKLYYLYRRVKIFFILPLKKILPQSIIRTIQTRSRKNTK